jgi:NTE family protein
MLGMALEGGGARGAFHMGAYKALLENGYEFGAVTGTSIGALNGAIIAQGDFEAGLRMWESINTTMLFDIDEEYYNNLINRKLDKNTVLHLASMVRAAIGNKGIDTGKMRKVVESVIDEEKLRNSKTDFGLVTVALSGMKPMELFKDEIQQGQMIDYLMASASFPGFASKEIDGKRYADGGLYDNLPVNLLASRGYNEIIAVRTYGVGLSQKLRYKNLKITNILPSEDLGQIFDFDHELICRNLKMGYYDALRVIKGLSGRHYYIEPLDDAYYFELFSSITDETICSLVKIFGLPQGSPKRMLFERIIPKLAEMLGLKANATYETIFINLMEVVAEKNAVDKYTVYVLNDFLGEISKSTSAESTVKIKSPFPMRFQGQKAQLLCAAQEIFAAVNHR